ncbi:Single insulin-like growth factor-binding domain protein-2 [Oopsacas minuta]|uniref:Single insulin-like growth factor-binding domain protein-2 n=1 Tax=Oopsacas minuta TaxID=111878 RepID=A0AAV7K3V3_9METZ|nr:Single insulin-like growth factor-binding domain protein-2 [Oopsacas minuta]
MQIFRNCLLFVFFILVLKKANLLSCRKKCNKYLENCQNQECVGSFYLDVCGCCKICSKQNTEICGGVWGQYGRCEVGLACVRNPGDTHQLPGYCRPIENGCYYNLLGRSADTQIASYGTSYRTEDNTLCVCKSRGKWKCRLEGDIDVWHDSMIIQYSGDGEITNDSSE